MRNLLGSQVSLYKGSVFGCHNCPLHGVSSVQRVLGLQRIRKRRAMLWAQSPGRRENEKGLELVGPTGTFLWDALSRFGLSRSDFDIQNVVRCWPVDHSGAEHKPTKQELTCCSAYSEAALDRNAGHAVVHLILGEVAGIQLLGNDYRKSRPVFWHEPWGANVVLAPHPSYICRSGGKSAGWIYEEFCNRLRAVRQLLDHPGEWGYLKAQDYGAVHTPDAAAKLEQQIRHEARAGRRISVDIESDGPHLIMVGFGWGRLRKRSDPLTWTGGARSVVLDHPEAPHRGHQKALLRTVQTIIEDPTIPKVLQHGSSDKDVFRTAGMKLRGYTFDTQYAAYLRNSDLRTYALDAICARAFPAFGPYKTLLSKYQNPWHYYDAPLSDLVLYNCADCDVTKRSEAQDSPHVNAALVEVYLRVGIVLDKMEQRGPLLDREAHARVYQVVPAMLEETRQKLCHIAGRRDFNPNTPADVAWLLFDKLGLPEMAGRSTGAEVLNLLMLETGSPVPKLVIRHRTLHTMKTTFLDGYRRSADLHNGELRTVWWLTGAATGRLRSGKGEAAEKEGVLNFQNLHGNPLLQNLLVSDLDWRSAL